ncbi:hypothetical protein ACS0TY_019460 [Phlomoides rotata]
MDTAVKSPAFPFRRVFSPFKRRRPISFDAVPLLAGRQARLLRRHMRAPSSQPPFAPRRRRPRPQRRPANRRRRLFVPPPVRPRVSARRAAYRDSAAAALPPLRTRMSIREAYVRQLLELSKIGPFQSTTDDRAKLKVGVRLNLHGIVLIESTTVGATGKALKDVSAIGIGGSFLGPLFVHTALQTGSSNIAKCWVL